ncbi:hypothetical protein HCC75_12385 (plasmid) [Levilactobacillus brevis]|uniref:pyocin knob domain-containing protein n=1 Tax=Levilactobacillus brevis TaxID=1580 RepID=UPI0018660280|nr:pyocin knob domain-containing protein [Levilactobacillus brevis]QOP54112.1 hypothetical protein HCC75_12385 [Levilactobacillus brevis]
MATPNVGILTTTGKALIDKVNSGQAKISFSKVVFSSMDNSQLSDTQIKALTAIAPQEVVVSSPQTTLDTNSGETRIRATGTNEKLADGVYVKTYGVFAKDDTGNEILYGVTVSPNPNYFPAYDGVTPQAVTYSYKTVIQETSNITMTNSNDVYVSQEDLTEAIAKIPQPDLSGYDKTDDVDKKLQSKQDKLGYTAANDSAVVHSTDMRKPASDVAGLGDITTAYNQGGITDGTDVQSITKEGLYQLNGVSLINFINSGKQQGTLQVIYQGGALFQIARMADGSIYTNSYGGSPVSWTGWNKLADDSKVAHLSGANNFDTVPTVDSNPLLLASSLPSDLARTGQSNTFSLLQTFSQGVKTLQTGSYDDANSLVNEGLYFNTNLSIKNGAGEITAGFIQVLSGTWERVRQFMYSDVTNNLVYTRISSDNGSTWSKWVQIITSDQVPTDLARTSQQTNFTAGLQSGGVDVATAADLKSVEDASWHTITGKSDSLSAYTCMYRKNNEKKYVDLVLYGIMGISMAPSDSSKELLDLSGIISSINGVNGVISCPETAATGGGISGSMSISGTKLLFSWNVNNNILYSGRPIISVGNDLNSPFLRVTFD